MLLDDAFALFKRLGVDARSISAKEFTAAYLELAKRKPPSALRSPYHRRYRFEIVTAYLSSQTSSRRALLKMLFELTISFLTQGRRHWPRSA